MRICIALKNPSPRPFLNPRTLCSMAITLTITPQRNIHRPMEVVTTSVRLHDATSQKRSLPYDLMNCYAVFIIEKSCLSVRVLIFEATDWISTEFGRGIRRSALKHVERT
jgi:hypothetical protein